MAFQTPAFAYYHACAQDGIILTPTPAFTAAAPARHLTDYRIGAYTQFSAGVSPEIVIDRLVTTPEAVNRLTIPPNSNGGDITVTIDHAATDSWPGAGLGSATWTDGEWFDSALSGPSTLRYLKVVFSDGGSGVSNGCEIGELFFSFRHSLTQWGDHEWEESPRGTAISVELGAGWAATFDQPRRRTWSFRHQAADATNQAIYDNLFTQTHDGQIPFLFIPPNDAQGSVWVQIQPGSIRKEQAAPAPSVTGLYYSYEMTLVESTL